ncbi:MAG: DUF4346 domain-containing protein [candidate division WOR-3 bacterium]
MKVKKKFYSLIVFIAILLFHPVYYILRTSQISRQWAQIENVSILSIYFQRQEFFIGISYALAGAFTVYALIKYIERIMGVAGVLTGVTLTGILYLAGCFFLGCCGSPMLVVYLSLFGASFLKFTKPLVLLITFFSVTIGFIWMNKKKTPKSCCAENEKCISNLNEGSPKKSIGDILSELKKGMSLAKCKKCGCMKETLEQLQVFYKTKQISELTDIIKSVNTWLNQMEEIEYHCLGCEHCYPAVAMNNFVRIFPEYAAIQSTSCNFEINQEVWPPVPGEYFVLCDSKDCPVAVSTLASPQLSEKIANIRPEGLCIIGKTETENIGIEKVVKNVITNPTIRFLLLTGKDPKGHYSGQTFLALAKNGVDDGMKVVGSSGRLPIFRNLTREEISAFREQVQIVDMIGCEDASRIVDKIKELGSLSLKKITGSGKFTKTVAAPIVQAKETKKIAMDKAGYFIIIPQLQKGLIVVEHYSNRNELLRVIEGKDAASIYKTITENGWVTQLSHAAYLGKELTKAELSMKLGFKYIQDGAY